MGRHGVVMLTQRYHPIFGGAAVQARRLSGELVRRGWEVTVVTARMDASPRRERMDGILLVRTHLWGARSDVLRDLVAALGSLLPLLARARRWGVLHVHGATLFTLLPILLAKGLGKKVVVKMTLIGSDDARSLETRRFGWLRRWIFRLADAVVSISPPMSALYREAGLDASKLHEMPQGVDVGRYRPASGAEREALRRRLGLAPDAPTLVFVGAVFHRKGADIATEAFAHLAGERPDLRLVMVGQDESVQEPLEMPQHREFAGAVKERLREGRLLDRVMFTGVVDNVEDYLRAADVFLFPSRREGFGTVMVEAMACGLPCVVSALGGISSSLFTTGVDGVVVEAEDPLEYAHAVEALLASPETAARLGAAARRRVEGTHSFERVAQGYIALYESVLAGGAGRRLSRR